MLKRILQILVFAFGAVVVATLLANFRKLDREDLIQGIYETQCIPFGKDDRHGFIATAAISNQELKINFDMFKDNQCLTQSLEIFYSGNFSVLTEDEPQPIDHNPAVANMTIFDREVLEHYIKNKHCGIDSWELRQSTNVLGRHCEPFQMPTKRVIIEDIFAVESNVLKFGLLPLQWHSESGRPTSLSSVGFLRVK